MRVFKITGPLSQCAWFLLEYADWDGVISLDIIISRLERLGALLNNIIKY